MNQHQNYLIINCGYTSRLIDKVDEMETKPIFIYDRVWGDGLTKYDCTDAEIDMLIDLHDIVTDGTIVFRYSENEQINIVETVKMLQRFEHCGFFYIDQYYGEDVDDEDLRREIVDADLVNFVYHSDEYYYGTLFEVKMTDLPNYKVIRLDFDSESG